MKKISLLFILLPFICSLQAQTKKNNAVFPDNSGLKDTTTSATRHSTQLASFEHIFAVLDEETAKAIASSAYLHVFCGVEQKTMVSDEGHYRGTYLAGEENYVELFGPADRNLEGPPSAPGSVGLGLNTERIKGLEPIKLALDKSGVSSGITSFHRTFGNQKVDWFRALEISPASDSSAEKSGKPEVDIFIAEIVPSYFDVPGANKPPSRGKDDVVSLRRYHQNDYKHRLMKNVSAIALAITHEDWRIFRLMLEASGYKITEHNNEASAAGDVSMTFLFVPKENVGIRRIDFILNESINNRHIEILGHSRLEVGPKAHAIWTFTPQVGK